MRAERLAAVGLAVIVVFGFGLVAPGAVAAIHAGLEALGGATASFDLTATFYSSSFATAQPSPYCNIGTASEPFDLICLTPQDIKTAYNYPTNLNGAGQTIVIVDPFGDPLIQSDLNAFDAAFNLPATTVQIVCQNGVCPVFNATNATELGWTLEEDLDVEYSHAMAPGAHIVLFVATSNDDLVLEQGVLQAVEEFPHSIISQSWGDAELDLLTAPLSYVSAVLSTGEFAYELAAAEGTTVFASAGDYGATDGYATATPEWPSSSPWVTAVGGTMGDPYYAGSIPSCGHAPFCSTGLVVFANTPGCQLNNPTPTSSAACVPVGYGGEQTWNEPLFGAATGGAPSLIFGTPAYQKGLGLTSRATPDVSYSAAISGGGILYWGFGVPAGFYFAGGTSYGSPQWSGIAALADQYAALHHEGTIGFIDPAVYEIGHTPTLYAQDFHDITVGNNTLYGTTVGFPAKRGWDDATGWGTPNVANLIPTLVALT